MKPIIVAPSILSADFNKLGEEIKLISDAGADYLHFDVMDGHFVPNISFGLPVLKDVAHTHKLVNDVHIMISEPLKYAERFCLAGADILTFHYEACKDIEEVLEVIDIIHKNNVKAGISIKPGTNVSCLDSIISKVDLVLVMSVEPGFGGQKFIPNALDKIKYLREKIDRENLLTIIEVDGGINEVTAKSCIDAGVDALVAGSYLFGHDDIKERIEKLHG